MRCTSNATLLLPLQRGRGYKLCLAHRKILALVYGATPPLWESFPYFTERHISSIFLWPRFYGERAPIPASLKTTMEVPAAGFWRGFCWWGPHILPEQPTFLKSRLERIAEWVPSLMVDCAIRFAWENSCARIKYLLTSITKAQAARSRRQSRPLRDNNIDRSKQCQTLMRLWMKGSTSEAPMLDSFLAPVKIWGTSKSRDALATRKPHFALSFR
jgi:hypothetical protein